MRRLPALFLLFVFLVLAACEQPEVQLPEGPQTIRGYLQPVPFSLKRRGTHALYTGSGGTMIAYAESSTVNLRAIERTEVELQGILERNTDPKEHPVFVVQKILSGGDALMKPWKIPALGLSLSLPAEWKGSIKGGSATFTASGFSLPILSITTRKTAPVPSPQALYGPLAVSSPGELLVVGLRKAVAEDDMAAELWTVRVQPPPGGASETVFTFALRTADSVASQILLYKNVLKTVTFTMGATVASRSSIPAVPATGSSASGAAGSRAVGEGSACGGVAGILCPKGLFCRITDPVSESGVCTKR